MEDTRRHRPSPGKGGFFSPARSRGRGRPVLLLLAAVLSAGSAAAAVRSPAVAGAFYPADRAELERTLEELFERAAEPPSAPGIPVGAIVPHAGYVFSGKTAAGVFRALGTRNDVERIVLLGPSHYGAFRGVALPADEGWETPLGVYRVDTAFVARLRESGVFLEPRAEARPEHSIEVEVPFLQKTFPGARFVPLLVGSPSRETMRRVARTLAEMIDDRTLLIASSDFTHFGPRYGYVPFREDVPNRLEELDAGAADRIVELKPDAFLDYQEETGATICGRFPIYILLHTIRDRWPTGIRGRLLERTTSGDATGDFRNCVTYLGILFRRTSPEHRSTPVPDLAANTVSAPGSTESKTMNENEDATLLSEEEQKQLLRLARRTIERAVREHDVRVEPPPEGVSDRLRAPGKVFVTLKERGMLRGCIGTLEPIESLWESVERNAVNAALKDWRFPPVRPEEIDELEIEISVMSPNRPIPGPEAFEVGIHGIILQKNGRSAVFLPQVAPEQGWDRETTLRHLSIKAGLPEDAWKTGASFEVFTAQVFSESELGLR